MSKPIRILLSCAALAASLGLAGTAGAADPGFCRDYASQAMQQVDAAQNSRRCGWEVRHNPARWTPDYRSHFDWCRHTSTKNVNRERRGRREALDNCLRGDGGQNDRGDWRGGADDYRYHHQ